MVFGSRPRLSCIVARLYGIVRGAMLLCGARLVGLCFIAVIFRLWCAFVLSLVRLYGRFAFVPL